MTDRERPDLPEDPDWEHVPAELRAADGKLVQVEDAETGEVVSGVLHVAPGVFGDAARAREHDGDEEP